MKMLGRLAPMGAVLGWLLGFSGVASGFTISFQNNTGLDQNSYMVCMQGYASVSAQFPNSANAQLTGSGNNYAFAAISPTPNGTDAQVAVPLPAYAVVPGTTVTVQSTPTFDITGSRIYYYVVPKSASCQAFLGYYVAKNSSTFAGFYNDFTAGGAYAFSEVASIDVPSSNVFDISMVDSFALPAQAYTTGNTAGYNTLGQTDVSPQSAQNLQAIRADFISAMSTLGASGEPYMPLATMAFSDEGQGYTYPSGIGPIYNPSAFLGQRIAPPTASGVFYPGANSSLNTVFDAALNSLFSSTIYVNKTGNAGDTYIGVPVATGLPYPNVGNPSVAPTSNPYLPTSLPGMLFCNSANSSNCTIGTASFIAYNPVGMTIGNLGSAASYSYLTGVLQANSRTINFASPLNVPQLINTGLFTNGIQGWYVTGATGNISAGNNYVVSCLPSCTDAAVTSITLDSSLVTQTVAVSGQLLLQAWPPGTGLGAPAPSSGYSVFGNVGVLGGISWPTNSADIINVLVAALNRGVSALRNTQHDFTDVTHTDSYLWSQESNWYPSGQVLNQYSNYLHTRLLGGEPLFARPTPFANSAQGMPMGMAYGFGYDEDPMNGVIGPAVASKWDGNVNADARINVTLGPWFPQSPVSQYLLQVTKAGTGASDGVVTSIAVNPPGMAIDCGTDCSASYDVGTTVTLKASGTSKFTGWSGACTGTTLTCAVMMSQAQNVTASFATTGSNYPLHVSVGGQGSVTGGGINCGTTCSSEETSGSQVTLTATPQGGARFVGWSGACGGSISTCVVTMTQAQQVTATFATPQQYSLTVTNGGGGVATSAPAGIDCGSACIASFSAGAAVSVIAKPADGYVFSGWSGACSGTQTCDLIMNSNKAVTATFSAAPPGKVSLTVHDYGSGRVVSNPAGIDCGSACSYAYDIGTLVTLTAVPTIGSTFSGWSGGVCAGTGHCLVALQEAETVNAVFVANPPPPPNAIPTLSEWVRTVLILLLVGAAGWQLRTRATRR